MRRPRCARLWYTSMEAPLAGQLWLAATEQGLCAIAFDGDEGVFVARLERVWGVHPLLAFAPLAEAMRQLSEYLAGERQVFTLPLDLRQLRPFQQQALQATQTVPWGQVTTYRALAHKIGRPRAMRAVGRAEATNPIPIIIPCHRVIGSDGSLRGYGGGLDMKCALLRLEGVMLCD